MGDQTTSSGFLLEVKIHFANIEILKFKIYLNHLYNSFSLALRVALKTFSLLI